MKDKISSLHILRRISQVLFILLIMLIPILDIFRLDSHTGTLIVFGNHWELGLKEAFYADRSLESISRVTMQFFLKAILPWVVVLSVFPLMGFLLGRFFCGWFCPEGTLFELADFLTSKILGRRNLFTKTGESLTSSRKTRYFYSVVAAFCALSIPLLVGIALTGYFVKPATIWSQIINWQFTFGVKAGIIGVSIYMLISSIIVRHTLCKYVCGAGLMQMLLGWVSPVSLRIKLDTGRLSSCTDCKQCEKVCFMNVKPRLPRRDINCVNCGECITACHKELGQGNGLFSFSCPKPDLTKEKRETVDLRLNKQSFIRR
ncbi:MAG: 4Fe-4S binding protein [Nitrospirota bacterium]